MIVVDNGDAIRGDASAATVVDYTVNGVVGTAATQLADGQLAAAEADVYLSGADAIVVLSITLVNTDTSARTCNLYLKPSAGTSRRIIPKDTSLAAGYSLHTDGVKVYVMSTTGQIVQTYSAHATSHTDGTNDIQSSSLTQKGIVELATGAETTTGTDATRAVTPDGLKDGYQGSSNVATVGTVISGTLSTGAVLADVTMTLGSDADGDTYYRTSNKLTRLAKGTATEVLTMNAGATAPEWAAAGSGATIVHKAADETVNNSTTLQNDDHLLFAVGANDIWVFHLWFIVETGTTPDFKFAFAVPSGGACIYCMDINGVYLRPLEDATTAKTLAQTATPGIFNRLLRYVGGGTAGNLQLQWAQNTAEVSNTILKENSLLIAWKVG